MVKSKTLLSSVKKRYSRAKFINFSMYIFLILFSLDVLGQEKELKQITNYIEGLDSHYSSINAKNRERIKRLRESIDLLNKENLELSSIIEKEKINLAAYDSVSNYIRKHGKLYFLLDSINSVPFEKPLNNKNLLNVLIKRKNEKILILTLSKPNNELKINTYEFKGDRKVEKILSKIEKSGIMQYNISRNKIIEITEAESGQSAKSSILYNNGKVSQLKIEIESINSMNIDSLKSVDRKKLLDLRNYYNEFLNTKALYLKQLDKAKAIDDKNISDYNAKMLEYEKKSGENTQMPTEKEAIKYFNSFKKSLKDPYSAILETYGVRPLRKTNKKYPCVKCVNLGIRAKNGFGGYILSKYYVLVRDGKVIDYAEANRDLEYMLDNMMSLSLSMNKVTCENAPVEPIEPVSKANKLTEPKPRQLDFNYTK